MKKILLFLVVAILLFPNMNENRKIANHFFSQGMNERVTNKIFNKSPLFNFHNIFSFILLKRLEIDASKTITVNEEVMIRVPSEGLPVKGATVLANGLAIGETNSNGELIYTFTEPGVVALIAKKTGYLPSGKFSLKVNPVSSLPELNIEMPVAVSVNEGVTIRVTSSGTPVEGVDILINGMKVGETDEKGRFNYTFEISGMAIVVAKKEGYLMDEFTIRVEPLLEELEGAIFQPSTYAVETIKEYILNQIPTENLGYIESHEISGFKQHILLSKGGIAILLSGIDIPVCNGKVKGYSIGTVSYGGYSWRIFYVKNLTYCDTEGLPTTVDKIVNNTDEYKFKLLNISTHYRAISLSLMYEEMGLAIPLTMGYISDHERTNENFFQKMVELASGFNSSKNLDRKNIEDILQVRSKNRIAVAGFDPSYWIDSEAYVRGILLRDGSVKACLSLMPEGLEDILIPSGTKTLLVEEGKLVKGEEVNIEDIRNNPTAYEGKQVIFPAVSIGVNISINQAIEQGLKAMSSMVPELIPLIAIAETNPVDAIVYGGASWYPAIPSNGYQIISVFGVLSYEGSPPLLLFEVVNERKVVSKIYGYVLHDNFGFDIPVIVIQDKKFVREVAKGGIKEDVKNLIEELRENMEKKLKNDIEMGSGISAYRPARCIFPVIEAEKPTVFNIENSIIRNITIETKSLLSNVNISMVKLPEKPPEVLTKPQGTIYSYFKIEIYAEGGELEKVNLTINFKVEKKWISKKSVDKTAIKLCRWHEEKWQKLPTYILGENESSVYFSAKSCGLSYYSVVAVKSTSSQRQTPGFSVLTIAIALFLVAYLMKRKKTFF